MIKNYQEIIENNLSLFDKLFNLKYFYMLLNLILSLDIYLIFEFEKSILSIDFVSIINQENVKHLIQYIICFGFMLSVFIPFMRRGIYKILFNVIGQKTLNNINNQKQNNPDYISVDLLYREALLEQNKYKLDRVNEHRKYKEEIRKLTNIVMSMIIFFIIDLLVSKNDSISICRQLIHQLSVINNKMLKLFIISLIGAV